MTLDIRLFHKCVSSVKNLKAWLAFFKTYSNNIIIIYHIIYDKYQ